MRWTERRERFRAILEGKDCIHPASVFDPLSARIAEDLGFELGHSVGLPHSFDGKRPAIRSRPPALGEHTLELLQIKEP